MSSRAVSDLYLPSKVAYHVKILLGGILITIFFNLIWTGTFFTPGFWITLAFVIIQLEIFMIIALKIFAVRVGKPSKEYKTTIITRLAAFYLIVLVIATAFIFLAVLSSTPFGDAQLSDILEKFVSDGLKRFLFSWIISITIASAAFFYMEWNNALKREQKLREEKLIFQYETLKGQVNPHFLFNSLNTLSSLIPKDPELSERFISKFSSIYRYILEKADKDVVRLDEEIRFVENYFFLQKIRDDGKINMRIEIGRPEPYQILPISLQLLVENALKHNAATHENPLNIRIYLEHDDILIVENNVQRKMNLEPSSKIGLKNLKERIFLMTRKQLSVEERTDRFLVKLPIIRTDHEGVDNRR
jgi:two-component system, LytTR family, sensor kinase